MTKYGNKATTIDNITFHSKSEAEYYKILKLRLNAGEIKDLELQPRFPIRVHGSHICTYVADFAHFDKKLNETVITDVKGVLTDTSRIKIKLFEAIYNKQVELIHARTFRPYSLGTSRNLSKPRNPSEIVIPK